MVRMMDFAKVRKKLLSAESGRITKKSSIIKIALGFPNTYQIGMSNLGFQTIYRLLNETEQVSCERFFLFDFPLQKGTKTFESDRNIKDFDLIAFSIPFELDYPNVLRLLKLSRIPLLAADRKSVTPLIIGGGVAPTLNPEVPAPFFDCIFIGEAEGTIEEFVDQYLSLRSQGLEKEEMLLELTKIKGLYVPRFYEASYDENGMVKKISARPRVPPRVQRSSASLEGVETFSPLASPLAHFKNTLLVEVGRGCARGCRFCAAGHIYLPCRFYTRDSILSQVEKHAGESRHVGLIGSLISDHPKLEEVCESLYQQGYEIGTSSLRADKVGSNLLRILVDSGMKTLTVAPEVGTERMWKVINKNIDREAVLKSAKLASDSLIPNLKLYFIIGLPFEKEEDIRGIVDLIRQVHQVFIKESKPIKSGKRIRLRKLRISVNPFIPKPHTPFQWCAMDRQEELKRKLNIIAEGVRDLEGVHFERKSVRQAILQGILSQGNRKVGEGLFYWINNDLNLRQAWKKAGVDLDLIVFKLKSLDSFLPWDLIDSGVSKRHLREEYQKAESIANEW
jgi:radical SAM superfamily enzyme YgiQ (UPF0313 family)